MTLSEYYEALEDHDWFYTLSDDHKVYMRGLMYEVELLMTAEIHGIEFKNLYTDFYECYYKSFLDGEVRIKPQRPLDA